MLGMKNEEPDAFDQAALVRCISLPAAEAPAAGSLEVVYRSRAAGFYTAPHNGQVWSSLSAPQL